MKKFEYRFQGIEDVKEKIKKNTEKEFAVILMKIKDKQEEIQIVKQELSGSFSEHGKLTPQEMIFLEKYRDSLKMRIDRKENELKKLNKEKNAKQLELNKHHKEHKIFVKLKEKQFNEYKEELKKFEQKSTDEIANQKFNSAEK